MSGADGVPAATGIGLAAGAVGDGADAAGEWRGADGAADGEPLPLVPGTNK
jgi:hypothetical protein